MSQQENTVLLVYRMVGDRRIPYNLELDSTMTVVSDSPNLDLLKSQALIERQALVLPKPTITATSSQKAEVKAAASNLTDEANADVAALIKQAALEGHMVKTSNPKLLEKFPELTLMGNEELASLTNGEGASTAQSADESEAVTKLIRQAKQDGYVVKTSNPDLLAKYPDLSPEQREELAESMQGEVEVRELSDGRVQRVYKPTPTDILMGTWVTDIVEENPIPGTDDLRAQYFAEIAELEAKHAKNGTVCPSCDIGAVMRKWRVKLKKLGFIE